MFGFWEVGVTRMVKVMDYFARVTYFKGLRACTEVFSLFVTVSRYLVVVRRRFCLLLLGVDVFVG